jgi:hypothetical protein
LSSTSSCSIPSGRYSRSPAYTACHGSSHRVCISLINYSFANLPLTNTLDSPTSLHHLPPRHVQRALLAVRLRRAVRLLRPTALLPWVNLPGRPGWRRVHILQFRAVDGLGGVVDARAVQVEARIGQSAAGGGGGRERGGNKQRSCRDKAGVSRANWRGCSICLEKASIFLGWGAVLLDSMSARNSSYIDKTCANVKGVCSGRTGGTWHARSQQWVSFQPYYGCYRDVGWTIVAGRLHLRLRYVYYLCTSKFPPDVGVVTWYRERTRSVFLGDNDLTSACEPHAADEQDKQGLDVLRWVIIRGGFLTFYHWLCTACHFGHWQSGCVCYVDPECHTWRQLDDDYAQQLGIHSESIQDCYRSLGCQTAAIRREDQRIPSRNSSHLKVVNLEQLCSLSRYCRTVTPGA